MAMKDIFINFALAGLFVVAMLGFIINIQTDNNLNETLRNNEILNNSYVDLNSQLDSYQSSAEGQNEVQDTDNPLTEGGNLLFVSITKTGKTLKGMVTGVYNIIIKIPSKLLGIPEIVMSVITTILIISLVLYAWRLYKLGE